MKPGPKAQVFFLGPQKDGVANAEAINGKPPGDLGFQDTGKQGWGGLEDGREEGKSRA